MNMMIMAVDDEANMLHLIELVLKRLRCTVVKVSNPLDATQLLTSVTPDLFVLDVMMPQMNGIELCQYIRSLPETTRTPIIMLSAHYSREAVARALQAGADVYLPKTALHSELVPQVRTLLNLPAMPSNGYTSDSARLLY
ncbi:MAG: response regulator [Chloroflexi bacterium]|nr:response regulator [Chloroflexota bacterium]